MSVRRAQSEIDSAEFAEWAAYHTTEPFTHQRSENVLCIVASILANVNRKKGTAPYKPADFLPKYGGKRKTIDSAKEIEMKLRAIFKHGNN